jgi:3'-5' exoribonuclease
MKLIYNLSEINYETQDSVEFEATVIELLTEGSKENKRPMVFVVKIENSGENLKVVSWTYDLLQIIKDGVNSIEVILFEGLAGIFKENQQIRIGNARLANKQSTKKKLNRVDIISVKREMNAVINQYITTPIIRSLLETLILNESKFFEWPAATKIHHNYEGGLAVHTLQVVKNAIMMWQQYSLTTTLDIEVVVAGAMLHDVGKLSEYNKDGTRTVLGQLVTHLTDGAERVALFCFQNGIDSNRDKKILAIKHIILSHHEKLEFNAAITPAILEAFIVAKSDALDGNFEGIRKEVELLQPGQVSDRIIAADGGKYVKLW